VSESHKGREVQRVIGIVGARKKMRELVTVRESESEREIVCEREKVRDK